MSWELLALFAALCYGAGNLIQKHIMKTESTIVYTWFFNIIISVFGGYLFHKEKDLWKRLIGALFIIAGASLVLRPVF